MHMAFVYGTLMSGYGNHRLLQDSTFYAPGITVDQYNFFTLGPFPAVQKSETADDQHRVEGELYQINDRTLARLDQLESNGSLYLRRRRAIEVFLEAKPTRMIAWVYEFLGAPYNMGQGSTLRTPKTCPEQFWVDGEGVALWSAQGVYR